MAASKDWLETLLRQEHGLLLTRLSAAGTAAELRQVADAALTLAADLIAVRTGGPLLGLGGLPFWHFPDLAAFLRDWPVLDGDGGGGTAGGADGGTDGDGGGKTRAAPLAEADMPAIAAGLRGRGIFLLRQRLPGGDGAVLAIDSGLTGMDRMIGFLFLLALRRPAGPGDVRSIIDDIAPQAGGPLPASPEVTAELFRIILDSAEAAADPAGWSWPWR